MSITATEREALDEFSARVRRRFGPRVSKLALFGSKARGDEHQDSDIDVCVAIDGLTESERRDVYDIAGDILGEKEVLLSAFVVSAEHLDFLRQRERTIAREIARDGIAL